MDHFQSEKLLNYDQKLITGILSGEAESLRFISDIWAFAPSERDKEQFRRFCEFVRTFASSGDLREAVAKVGVYLTTGLDWRNGTSIPFLARLYRKSISLGKPNPGHKWIPLRIARNGSSFERLIQVPTAVQSELDILAVLRQLRREASIQDFGFLLGVMLGDAGKGTNLYVKGNHRIPTYNLLLRLSQHNQHNKRFGEYLVTCCNKLGLRAGRISDGPPSSLQRMSTAKAMNYNWRSQRSPFLAWMFMVCLGLQFGETTTRTPVRMGWILGTSRAFRIAFLQGLAESDGSASYSGYARITSWPSAEFVAELVRSLGVTCSIARKRGRPSDVAITIDQAFSIQLFNAEIASERYLRVKKMAEGRRVQRWPRHIVDLVENLSKTLRAPDVTCRILDEYHIFIRAGSISRYLCKRGKSYPYSADQR